MSRARSPINSRQHLSRAALERPVRDGRNPEGALFRLTGLGDIDPPSPARDTLGGGWIGASALSMLQSSPSLPPPSGHPPRRRSALESVTDSSAPVRA